MVQGMADIWYINIPFLNHVLFFIVILMFIGLALMNVSFIRNKSFMEDDCNHKLPV